MFFEETTLAATTTAIIDALEPYGVDIDGLFAKAGLDRSVLNVPGARYPTDNTERLWILAREATGDPCIGIFAGRRIRPQALHALGFSWLASPTLLDGLRRVARYARVVDSTLKPQVIVERETVRVIHEIDADAILVSDEGIDAFLAAIVHVCRLMSSPEFAPRAVTIQHPDNGHIDQYIEFFKSPITFDAGEDALHFDLEPLEEHLPASNLDLAHANDRVAESYLATLDPNLVQDKVRQILLDMLPSGEVRQDLVAGELHRSVSSLQRSLRSEGVSYREILDGTRRSLAHQFIREKEYSLSEIAYLLGFSDQGNFTRAFKRWTGSTPTRYRS